MKHPRHWDGYTWALAIGVVAAVVYVATAVWFAVQPTPGDPPAPPALNRAYPIDTSPHYAHNNQPV